MKKTYIIIAAVVIALWAAFMVFRHMNQKKSRQTHHEETYSRMVEAAKKSPRAGLAQMGHALNRYFQDNKEYPGSLNDLYPKYIASRALITEIDWNYEPGAGDFSLSKSIVYNNREMVASIDRSLKPEIETGVAVAGRPVPARRKIPARVEAVEPPEEEPLTIADLVIVDELKMTGSETEVVAAAAGSSLIVADAVAPKAVSVQRELARVVAMVGPEIVSAEKTEFVSRNLERYLVWKDGNGFIGVSNVQFPEAEKNMYVAVHDTWYRVKRRRPEIPAGVVSDRAEAVPDKKREAGQLALDLSKQYLVWKDENGVIGVGNIQYPDTGQLTIASWDEWGPLEREPLPPTPTAKIAEIKKAPMDTDQLAANLSSSYLVWKDENGVIGIGNVQYPDRQRLKIASLEKLDTVTRETLPAGGIKKLPAARQQSDDEVAAGIRRNYLVWKDPDGVIGFGNVQYPDREPLEVASFDQWDTLKRKKLPASEIKKLPGTRQQSDDGAVAAGIRRDFLVWKDPDGVIGFGNVQYPDRRRLKVASFDQWDTVKQEPLTPREIKKLPEARRQSDGGAVAAGISGNYLMWKDKDGVIGFGNVQYPEMKKISHVRADQNWEKVTN